MNFQIKKKRNLRKYSVVFFKHFPKKKVFGGPCRISNMVWTVWHIASLCWNHISCMSKSIDQSINDYWKITKLNIVFREIYGVSPKFWTNSDFLDPMWIRIINKFDNFLYLSKSRPYHWRWFFDEMAEKIIQRTRCSLRVMPIHL